MNARSCVVRVHQIPLSGLLLALTLVASARGGGPSEGEITVGEIDAHARFIASEECAGRAAGHRGAEIAADYIVTELKNYGYEPLGDWWYLPFYMRGAATVGTATLLLGEETASDSALVQPPHFSAEGVVRAPVTMNAEGDVTGKIVAVELGEYDRAQSLELIERGAAGVILLREEETLEPYPPPSPHTFIGEKGAEEWLPELKEEARRNLLLTMRLAAPVVAVSSRLRDALEALASAGDEVQLDVQRVGEDESTNVAGVLVGADPALRDEYVIIGGHYDHIGTKDGDVFYGADDNASGTSALLEIAEAVAALERRPRRSIVVIAWGGEEQGMVGSKAFCRNPPIDLGKVAAVINLDMIGRNEPESVWVLAASEDLRGLAVAASERHGFTSTDGEDMYLGASDTLHFVLRGVPSVFFSTGLHGDYNTPRDTADRLDMAKIARIARAAFEVAVEVANADERPGFTPEPTITP